MTLIQIKDLTKTYRMGSVEVPALRGVTFNIEEGEFVAIMGPSGSGKSTLMNLLGCLDRPTSGTYTLDGVNVGKLRDASRAYIRNLKLGFVFQSFNLLPSLSAQRNVMLPMLYADRKKDHGRAKMLLESVGLGKRVHHTPMQLSGGEQQRVAIARSLINDPPLILGDEPTGNLDTATSEEIMGTFQRLNDAGKTVILVTHEQDIAMHAKRILRFRDGHLESDEMIENRLIAASKTPWASLSSGLIVLPNCSRHSGANLHQAAQAISFCGLTMYLPH
jgi:putative ABC transport system ATP-binding protein